MKKNIELLFQINQEKIITNSLMNNVLRINNKMKYSVTGDKWVWEKWLMCYCICESGYFEQILGGEKLTDSNLQYCRYIFSALV